jgi:hypothetical protein
VVKVEIEIPDPPEGWVFDGYRQVGAGEMSLLDNRQWSICQYSGTDYSDLVCVKAKPLWEPSPELVGVLRQGWVTRNKGGYCRHHIDEPKKNSNWGWYSYEMNSLEAIRPDLLPPKTIPWDQCCFKIGDPQE